MEKCVFFRLYEIERRKDRKVYINIIKNMNNILKLNKKTTLKV